MTNVIQLTRPSRTQTPEARTGALLHSFAAERRTGDDVFWLKENAEILNILECTGARLDDTALAAHRGFYATVEKRLRFFPQYYRFLLSITLDLEALGMPGDKGAELVDWAASQELAMAELSDLQRMEARRLMARRGCDPLPRDSGLEDRMRAFMGRSQTFALPNKKAAYELTHAVFYLSEYGRTDPALEPAAITSLNYAGLLAYLDQNADLLAEICIALRFAGETPPPLWTDWLDRETHLFELTTSPQASVQDDYHEYLVCNWHQAVAGERSFIQPVVPGRVRFDRSPVRSAALREMSECMFRMDGARSGDWQQMRGHMQAQLSAEAMGVIRMAESSCALFADFFEGFARADGAGRPA